MSVFGLITDCSSVLKLRRRVITNFAKPKKKTTKQLTNALLDIFEYGLVLG